MKDLGKIMQQAQQMQAKMKEAQEKIEQVEAEGVAGAGLVKVRLRGKGARLFSFWVGSACGESRGYVAAGSARFNTTRDRAGGC